MGAFKGAAILVVDDDSSIRRFTCLLLKRVTEAEVLEAASPRDSLRIARTSKTPVRLLISDIDLRAEMDGVALASEIVAMSPETRVVLISGDDSPRNGLRPEWRFVRKPFGVAEFIDAVDSLFLPDDSLLPAFRLPASYAVPARP
jgi:DNA-binding NtrC family response regulator